MIQDHRIDWMRKRIRLTPYDMQSILDDATSGVPASAFTGGVLLLEIGTLGFISCSMVAGEFLKGIYPVPSDLDPQFPVGYRVHYTVDHDGSGDATVSWILLNSFIGEGVVIADPATALNTPIPLLDAYTTDAGVSVTTDFLYQVSGRGIDNDIGLTRTQIETGALMGTSLEMDAMANATDVRLLWLEMDYVPMKTLGAGSNLDRALQSDGVA